MNYLNRLALSAILVMSVSVHHKGSAHGILVHLNLREHYLPYKKLIADILLDKNPKVRTVINKIDDVGEHSQYRTFNYELLAGIHEMNVEIREHNCVFNFDYSKVYWNSRLEGEHTRIVDKFQPGQAVCDVMAGVGPFAIPAGKKRCFVWANDLNPESHASLKHAVDRNKVRNSAQFRTPESQVSNKSQGFSIRQDLPRRWPYIYQNGNE